MPNNTYHSDVAGNTLMRDALQHTVRDFVMTQVNHGKTGTFSKDERVYGDGQEFMLALGEAPLAGEKLAWAIAGGIGSKIDEYVTEIEAAHSAKNSASLAIYTRKLADLYAKPEKAATAYLRNLQAMNIGQALPKPSEVIAAMQSEEVKAKLKRHEIMAFIYLKGAEGWKQYMQQQHANLEVLDAQHYLGEHGRAILVECPNSIKIRLHYNHGIMDDEALQKLLKYPHVIELNIQNLLISGRSIKYISVHPSLETLDIGFNLSIQSEDILALKGHPTLASLSLDYLSLNQAVMSFLAASKKITKLSLTYCKLDSKEIAEFSQNDTLTSLNIGWNNLGDEGAEVLARHPRLTVLDVSVNQITNTGAVALAKNTTLVSLKLQGNRIDDQGKASLLDNLKHNKNLLEYTGPGDDIVETYCYANFTHAKQYITALAEDKHFSPEEKTDLADRANAIQHLVKESETLSPEAKEKVTERLEAWLGRGGWAQQAAHNSPHRQRMGGPGAGSL